MCAYVCGLCNRISCYLVWYSWCTGLNWTGLSWTEAGQKGAMCVRVCVCVWGSVVACIIGLGTTWWGAVGAGHLPAVLPGSWLWPAIGCRPLGPPPAAACSQPAPSSAFPLPIPQRRKGSGKRRWANLPNGPFLCSRTNRVTVITKYSKGQAEEGNELGD